jgi:hypothetical protein
MGLLMQRVEKNIRQNYDRGRAAREAVGSLRVSPSHARRLQKLRPISRQRVPKPGIRFDQQSGGIVGRHRPDHGEHDHVTQHSANSRKRSCARGVTPISPKPATVVTTGMRTTHSTSAMRKIQSVPLGLAEIIHNQHYDSHGAYLDALAEALRTEYEAVVDEGFQIQIDAPITPSPMPESSSPIWRPPSWR